MRPIGRGSAVLLALLLSCALPLALAAAEGAADLAGEVLRLLKAEVGEEVILDWLASLPGPAQVPSADAMIALKEAGASDALLRALLARARDEPAPAAPAAPGAAPPETGAPPPASPPAAAPAARESGEEAAGEGVVVTFRLAYSPRFEGGDPRWDLFVYLDGKPLSYVPEAGFLERGATLEFRRRLLPGRHLLRVAQERHEERRGGRWLHAARVAGESFAFELAPGPPAEVELTFRQGWPGFGGGPLSFRAVQGERVVESEGVGGEPQDWASLCEEAEADDGRGAGDRGRRPADCVRWQELWPDGAPARDEVRRALAAFDYRPVPKNS